MKKEKKRYIKKLEEGSFIYLKGEYAIFKWEVVRLDEVRAYLKIVNDGSKEYMHPSHEFEVGQPLFRKGLRAYPYSSLLERDWQAFQSKKEMLALFRSMDRLERRLPSLRNSAKVLYCKSIIETFINDMKEALKKGNNAWRESKP